MKSYITALACALLCALCLLLPETAEAGKRLKGSGRIVSKEITVKGSFNAVYTSRGIHVKLVEGTSRKFLVEADDNVIDHVTATVKENRLTLSINSAYTSLSSLHVTVTVPTDGRLGKLHATSAGRIFAEPTIRSEKVRLAASSAGKIEARVEAVYCSADVSSAGSIRTEMKARECEFDASSSGKITATVAAEKCEVDASSAAQIILKGAVLKSDIEASSAGKINTSELAAKRAKLHVSSAGSISAYCLDTLEADASSGGAIRYTGECRVRRIHTSSGGSIRKK